MNKVSPLRKSGHMFPLRTFDEVGVFLNSNEGMNMSSRFNGYAFKKDFSPPSAFIALSMRDKVTLEAVGHVKAYAYTKKFITRNAGRLQKALGTEKDVTVVCKLGLNTKTDHEALYVYYVVYDDIVLFTEEEIGAVIDLTVFGMVPVETYATPENTDEYMAIPYVSDAKEFIYSPALIFTTVAAKPDNSPINVIGESA